MANISKDVATQLLERYSGMINKAAWRATRQFRFVGFDEFQAQAYLVFVEALQRWDPGIASFSTFLFNRLRTLYDYGCYQVRRRSLGEEALKAYSEVYSFDTFERTIDIVEEKARLSADARQVLDFILDRRWEVPGEFTKMTYFSAWKWYHYMYEWKPKRFKEAWEEIEGWWDAKLHPA